MLHDESAEAQKLSSLHLPEFPVCVIDQDQDSRTPAQAQSSALAIHQVLHSFARALPHEMALYKCANIIARQADGDNLIQGIFLE